MGAVFDRFPQQGPTGDSAPTSLAFPANEGWPAANKELLRVVGLIKADFQAFAEVSKVRARLGSIGELVFIPVAIEHGLGYDSYSY